MERIPHIAYHAALAPAPAPAPAAPRLYIAHGTHGTSSTFSNSSNASEDWTKISDLAERRRIQNRIAQRNYRKKLKRRLEDLEKRASFDGSSPADVPERHVPVPEFIPPMIYEEESQDLSTMLEQARQQLELLEEEEEDEDYHYQQSQPQLPQPSLHIPISYDHLMSLPQQTQSTRSPASSCSDTESTFSSAISRSSSAISRSSSATSRSSVSSLSSVSSVTTTFSKLSTPSTPWEDKYWCTSCDRSFRHKFDWRRHHEEFHERWRKYPCPDCNQSFWDPNTIDEDHEAVRGRTNCPHSHNMFRYMMRRAWGCGFCAAMHGKLEKHLDHVATHFEAGALRTDWMHSNVIYGLLHQPAIFDAWRDVLTRKQDKFNGHQPMFSWNLETTGRQQGYTEGETRGQLQDFLEFFDGSDEQAQSIAKCAWDDCHVILRPKSTTEPMDISEMQEMPPLASLVRRPGIRGRVRRSPSASLISIARQSEKEAQTMSLVSRPKPDDNEDYAEGIVAQPAAIRPAVDPELSLLSRVNRSVPGMDGSNTAPSHDWRQDLSLPNRDECLIPRPTSTESHTSSSGGSSKDSGEMSSSDEETFSIAEWKRVLLDRLMDYFFSILPSRTQACHRDGTDSQHQPSDRGSNASISDLDSTRASDSPNPGPTRGRQHSKRPADRDNDGDDERENKRQLKQSPEGPDGIPMRRFACPYFKRNPRRYQEERSCTGPGWKSVHRMKEHLYRCHMLPIHCLRCHETFTSQITLEVHSRAEPQCVVNRKKPAWLEERFNSDQEKLLRSRKKAPKDKSEEDKWREVFRILFPADDPALIPTPYHEYVNLSNDPPAPSSELERYETYLRRELPGRVRRELETRIDQALSPLEDSLRSELIDIVRDLQLTLFEEYKKVKDDTDETQEAVDTGEREQTEDASTGVPGWGSYSEGSTSGPSNTTPSIDDQLEAFRPEPYFEGQFSGFDGLLWDFQGNIMNQDWAESGYGSLHNNDPNEHLSLKPAEDGSEENRYGKASDVY